MTCQTAKRVAGCQNGVWSGVCFDVTEGVSFAECGTGGAHTVVKLQLHAYFFYCFVCHLSHPLSPTYIQRNRFSQPDDEKIIEKMEKPAKTKAVKGDSPL